MSNHFSASSSSRLALLGGQPVLRDPLPLYRSVGRSEIEAVNQVLDTGILSEFLGAPGEKFLGGRMVRQLEDAWCEKFGTRYAVSVNSATSGLGAAMGAIGIGPGDEVIVPPYTMSATVTAPLVYGGIPVFADIDPHTFCLDPASVRRNITPRSRAVIAVNLFGHPAPLAELRALCAEHGLFLIEDNAQAPLAREGSSYCGTIGDIGVFSLNYHKHIHTGEGGVCVTDNSRLADRLRLIRNHGENAAEDLGPDDLVNLLGFNYRLTEIGAAIALAQLQGSDEHVRRRERIGGRLSEMVEGLEGLTPPFVRPGCRHVYYLWALRVDEARLGISREQFSRALAAEGVPNSVGYVRPLYLLPLFQKRIAIGREGYPFKGSSVRYHEGLCPVVERMHSKELLLFHSTAYALSDEHLELLAEAIHKVHTQRADLGCEVVAG